MAYKNYKNFFLVFVSALLVAPFFCRADDATTTTSTYFNIDKGCGITIKDSASGGDVTCTSWEAGSQTMVSDVNVGTCICSPECLGEPEAHYYYDDPVQKTKQADANNITLPVVLAWDNVEAWQKEDGDVKWYWPALSHGDKLTLTSKLFGARSYVLEIDNTHGELNDSASAGGIFRKVMTTTELNSAESPLYPCFFNSDTTIKWRVRPCCKEDGSYCMPEENAAWWQFHTSPAPEPVWPKDPDWNGNSDAKNISFSDIKLKWCEANVSKEKQPYNNNLGASLSYQMRIYSNENQVVLSGKQIPAQFADLAKWLQKDVPALANPLSCHYLEKQQDNTCKADVINPIQSMTIRNSDNFYYWSHIEQPNIDRALFTKNLTYTWQLRQCYNNSNAGDNSCASNSNKNWGQLWKFTTKDEAVSSPAALAPENDSDYANPQAAKLTALPGKLQWSVPNGANSFAYDIQEINGNASQSLVGGEARTITSQVSFNKGGSTTNGANQSIDWKLNTAYKWRIKSCWPSIPVGDVCDSAWSPWYYFRTTGRAPKAELMKPQAAANNIALPVTLQWEAVPGAKSYILTFNGEKITTTTNQYALDYPKVDQNQAYSWKVQTCADINGALCGAESPEISFMTAALGASEKPNTAETLNNSQLIYNLSWTPVSGAHYYKVTLDYSQKSDKETNSACATGQKIESIVKDSSISVNKSIDQLYCLGKYDWKVLACLDQSCADTGAAPTTWSLNFVPGGAEIKKGATVLAVCGLTNDNPNTPWDDRETCGVKHILLTAEQIINLVLFKVSMILLPLLILGTGAMFYTQFGGPDIKQRVISWWKLIGIGYALLFFAWLIVGIFLALFGYHGAWWSI